MSKLSELSITLEGVGKALGANLLTVPTYQRAFAWEERHVRDLFDDVANAQENRDQEYFLGSVVVIPGDGDRLEVVDGQQRLATTAIFIAAVRDFLHLQAGSLPIGEEDVSREIERDFLIRRDRRTKDRVPKLQLNETDNDFFARYVLASPTEKILLPEARKPSHRKIKAAADHVRWRVAQIAKNSSDPINAIQDWLDFFVNNVKVIWVEVPDYANAFTIFETLNDRGVDLAVSDLLKNHLLRLSDDRARQIEKRWNEMVSTIESNSQDEIIVTFVRHLWSSLYGLARERELYQQIKKRVNNRASADEFSVRLLDASYVYAAITNPNHELWSDFGLAARRSVETLNDLGIIQVRPLLLAIMDQNQFTARDIEQSLAFLVSVAVRFLISGRAGTGRIEGIYTQQAKRIRDKSVRGADDLRRSMIDDVPSDSDFRIDFRNASVSKSSIARYYLRMLERAAQGPIPGELVVNPDHSEVNLEHVMPKRPDLSWDIDEDVRNAYVDRLGNLTLLTQKLNSRIRNGGFQVKRPHYAESKLALTRMIAEQYAVWTPEQIEDRQSKLAEFAVQAWSLGFKG